MRKGGSHAGTVTVLPAPADAPTRRAGRVLVDMQLNKIRMVLLRNHLESQAGSCTFERVDPASGLNGFATITAILFNCITIRLMIAWQLKVICNAIASGILWPTGHGSDGNRPEGDFHGAGSPLTRRSGALVTSRELARPAAPALAVR